MPRRGLNAFHILFPRMLSLSSNLATPFFEALNWKEIRLVWIVIICLNLKMLPLLLFLYSNILYLWLGNRINWDIFLQDLSSTSVCLERIFVHIVLHGEFWNRPSIHDYISRVLNSRTVSIFIHNFRIPLKKLVFYEQFSRFLSYQ